MLLRYSFELETEARAIESAVAQVLNAGHRTRDLAKPGQSRSEYVEKWAVK